MSGQRFEDLEVMVCGVTFLVTGIFYPEEKEWFNPREGVGNPKEPAFVEIESTHIEGQPSGDAETLLAAIKHDARLVGGYQIQFETGSDLLEAAIVQELSNHKE